MGDRIKALMTWWKNTRVARMLARYGVANGAMLSGGIAFSALFSIFAALVIGFSAFMLVIGDNIELRDRVIDTINGAMPMTLKQSTRLDVISYSKMASSSPSALMALSPTTASSGKM